ncbi:MAG TPA: hypothetical protein VM120_19820 [Bryobacteraceae bacterium]|nr:hypothetical protein [Bryobacteraceae bacterium]
METRTKSYAKVEPAVPETAQRIRQLQSRLMGGIADLGAKQVELESKRAEDMEELERELQEAFALLETKAKSVKAFPKIRSKVVDLVADRILSEWGISEEKSGTAESEVVERLVEQVLARLKEPGEAPQRGPG